MENKIIKALKNVIDPEIGFSVYDLGMIYEIQIVANHCRILMTLSTKSCPMHELLISWVKEAVLSVEECRECEVELVWEPTWNISMANKEVKEALGYA